MTLQGKTAIVTGASRGLGRAIAAAFLEQGAVVHATGRDSTAMAETEACLQATGGKFKMHRLEITDEASVVSFVASIDCIDVLVNNAGISRSRPFVETETEDLRRMLEVNTIAPFILMRETVKKMLPKGCGLIVNIASDVIYRRIGGAAPYVASKHALLGLGRSLSQELRNQGIRVTTYCPGPINTEMLGSGYPTALKPQHVAADIVHLANLPADMEVRDILVEPMGMDVP